jgi:hypothetical protein
LWAHHRLLGRPEQRRILMVISDGAPVDDSTLSANPGNYLEKHLREVIEWIETRSRSSSWPSASATTSPATTAARSPSPTPSSSAAPCSASSPASSRRHPACRRRSRDPGLPALGDQAAPGHPAGRKRGRRRVPPRCARTGPRLRLAWRRARPCRDGHRLARPARPRARAARLRRPPALAQGDGGRHAGARRGTDAGAQQLLGQAFGHADDRGASGRAGQGLRAGRSSGAAAYPGGPRGHGRRASARATRRRWLRHPRLDRLAAWSRPHGRPLRRPLGPPARTPGCHPPPRGRDARRALVRRRHRPAVHRPDAGGTLGAGQDRRRGRLLGRPARTRPRARAQGRGRRRQGCGARTARGLGSPRCAGRGRDSGSHELCQPHLAEPCGRRRWARSGSSPAGPN